MYKFQFTIHYSLFTNHYSLITILIMTKKTLTLLLLVFSIFNLFAQKKETYLYAVKDTSKLYLDVYLPKVQNEQIGRASCRDRV